VRRAIRAYDLRSLLAQIRERSDLDEDQALALAREELSKPPPPWFPSLIPRGVDTGRPLTRLVS
jgi:hypothetical protein